MIFVNLSFQYFVSCLSMTDLQLKLRSYIIVYGTVALTITRMFDTSTQANNILSFLASEYVHLLCLSSEFDQNLTRFVFPNRFCYSSTEVPALIKMIGPEPAVFKGVSERIDNVIEEIDAKLSRVRLF